MILHLCQTLSAYQCFISCKEAWHPLMATILRRLEQALLADTSMQHGMRSCWQPCVGMAFVADRLGHVCPVLLMHASLSIALRDVSRVRSPWASSERIACALKLHADGGNGYAESLVSHWFQVHLGCR